MKRQTAEQGRELINATKVLSLDERIAVIDSIAAELSVNFQTLKDDRKTQIKFEQAIITHGFAPIMFAAAMRCVTSRPENRIKSN